MKTFCIHNLPHLSVRWALDTHESGTGGGDGAKQKEKRDGTYKSGDQSLHDTVVFRLG